MVHVHFISDRNLPCPTVGITLSTQDGRIISSAATWEDNFHVDRDAAGSGKICLRIDQTPLLKGDYFVNAYLLCERGLHIYDAIENTITLNIKQTGRLQGFFPIPHTWLNDNP